MPSPRAAPVARSSNSRRSATALAALLIAGTTLTVAVPTATAAPGPHTWSEASPIYEFSMGRMIPSTQIQVDAEGNRMAVWNDYLEGQSLFASYAPAGGQWTAPIPIDSRVQSTILSFDFAMSANGDAVVAWLSHYLLFGGGVNRYSVDFAFYSAGAGWTYASTVSVDDPGLGGNPGRAGPPVVAIDSNGDSVILWTQTVDYFGSNETDLYAARHSGTWINFTTPEVIDTLPATPEFPDVAALDGDEDVAVWRQYDGSNQSLYSAVFTSAGGWSTPALRENSTEEVELLAIAAGAPREAYLVWSQGPPGLKEVYSTSFYSGNWTPVVKLDDEQGPHATLRISANTGGAGVAVWTMANHPNYPLRGATLDFLTGWGPTEELEPLDRYAPSTRPVIDASGDAMFLWMGLVDSVFPTVMAKRFVNGTGWLASEVVSGVYAAPDDLAISASGNASAAIRLFDGTIVRPYEARYVPVGSTPVDPVAALASQLDAIEATVASLQASLNNSSTQDSISTLWDALNKSEAELASLEANLTALKSTVDSGSASQGQVAARIGELETGLVTARAQLNTTSAAAAEASQVASRAESGASTATVALIAGIVGAALGAAGVALAIRAGSSNDMRVKEKGNRTKVGNAISGAEPGGDDAELDELRVKEKGNRTK